jgi:hypothetical protein
MAALEAFFWAFTQPMRHPAQLLAVVSLAMLVSLWDNDRADQGLVWIGVGCACGVAAAMYVDAMATDQFLLVCAVIAAVAVAEHSTLPRLLCAALTTFTGLGIGLGSTLPNEDASSLMAACVGLSLGACTWVFHGAAIAQHMSSLWGERPLRMLGSWAIAGAVILLTGILADPPVALALAGGGLR